MLTDRIRNMTPSATVELTARVAELRKQGIDVIAYNVGEPDFNTPQNICNAAVEAMEKGYTKYTPVAGLLELREAICEKLKKDNNLIYTPAEINVSVGAKQAIVDALMTICQKGDEVILPCPCWVSYDEMVKITEAKSVLVECKEENGFDLDIDAIEKAITPNTKAILINTPNNPTGAVYTEQSLRELANLALKHNIYIISDEVYEKLIYDGKTHFSIGSISDEVKNITITINGLSKAYAMTGWRIGYTAANKDIIKGMNSIQGHMTSSANSIAQYASIEALRGPQDTVEVMRNEFDRRRHYLIDRLNSMDGISCTGVSGAFYLLPNVSKLYGKKYNGKELKNSKDVCAFLLEEAKIAVVPGEAFFAPNNLRIAYSNSYENIVEGMDRMEKALLMLK